MTITDHRSNTSAQSMTNTATFTYQGRQWKQKEIKFVVKKISKTYTTDHKNLKLILSLV